MTLLRSRLLIRDSLLSPELRQAMLRGLRGDLVVRMDVLRVLKTQRSSFVSGSVRMKRMNATR
jgi:hypothetical protein